MLVAFKIKMDPKMCGKVKEHKSRRYINLSKKRSCKSFNILYDAQQSWRNKKNR